MRYFLRLGAAAIGAAVLGATGLLAACGSDGGGLPSGAKTIYMTALEYKGSAEVSKEAFPTAALPQGGGYGLKEPSGTPAKWEVNAYAWAPSSIAVVEGDEVTLEIMGVNGAEHVGAIQGHVDAFTVKRGQLTKLTFKAGEPGVYTISCSTHGPNMTGQLLVLAAR